MEIQGLPAGKNNPINNIEGKNTRKISQGISEKKSDTVIISDFPGTHDTALDMADIRVEFEPRNELVETISQRISDGKYDTRELLSSLAEKMVEADVLFSAVYNEFEFQARADRISEAEAQIETRNYDNQTVIKVIAGRLVHILGFSSLLGDKPEG